MLSRGGSVPVSAIVNTATTEWFITKGRGLLRYEVSIRSYGALSTTFRRKVGWIRNPPIHKPPPELIPLPAPAAILLPPTEPTPTSQCPQASQRPQEQEEDSAFLRKRKRSWAKLIAKVYLDDPEICRSCGNS